MARGRASLVPVAITLLLLVAGCSQAGQSAPVTDGAAAPDDDEKSDAGIASDGPVLADTLTRDCQRGGAGGGMDSAGLPVGATAVDFTLKDIHGTEFTLSRLLAEKPVVMVSGSFT